mmetsp:Transcript_38575/g.91044  ORF Transcript_38575/g.91044 Transcript_38575/m.91044 type:complete len:180 (-) Transcript_38575:59-598(-)
MAHDSMVDAAPHSHACPSNPQQDAPRTAMRERYGRRALGLKEVLFVSLLFVFSNACMIECFKQAQSRLFGTNQARHRQYGATFPLQQRRSDFADGSSAFLSGLRPVWRAASARTSCRAPLFRLRDAAAATTSRLKEFRLPLSLRTLRGSSGETAAEAKEEEEEVEEEREVEREVEWELS